MNSNEATSSLDTISERYVQEIILGLKDEGKTILIIAHRLSTVKNVDKLYVVNSGKVVEEGTHDELIHIKGYYSNLWKSQV